MNYKAMVEKAGKVAGAYAFKSAYAATPAAGVTDMDPTMTVKVLSDAFDIDEGVVENDILRRQEKEYERLAKLA